MEDNHKSTRSTFTFTSSGFPRSIDTINDSLSEVADKNNLDKDKEDIKFSTGWTVIQRRQTGRLNFTRSWEEYARGFGVADDEYWVGNEVMHALTTQKDYALRFVMEDMSSTIWEATYSQFTLSGKEDNYRIHLSGYYGNVSDGMIRCNVSAFSTVDSDNDSSSSHCSLYNGGGWWYSQCHVTNLNGPYNIGMVWFSYDRQDWIQMRSSVMMIRPKI
ncbi:unnamed protein product [Candidula unifasciata]|uniref:Fibrinogen C-terminal domain-containing protein n=1 Tax=Candidula unifasciata TaxID=100452 RepID=A0A8S3ZRM6_9EUPU|nr:unnamed protein product [Candidula unifasciata]